jgi:prolyl oligopeptidase
MQLTRHQEEIVHGVTITDSYRWLEDRGLPETQSWICAQQQQCDAYFAACPDLAVLERRVEEYLDIEAVDQPARVGDLYFYRRRCKGQEQGSIHVRERTGGTERLLIDPSKDGRFISVGIYRISPDGAYLAYEVRRGGEDRKEIRIVDVKSGVVLPDSIPLGYGRGLAFSSDGYLYSQETDDTADEHTICHHTLGSKAPDKVAFRIPRTTGSRLFVKGNAHRLGAFVLRQQDAKTVADLWTAGLEEGSVWVEVFRGKPLPYSAILCHDRIFVVLETESKSSRLIEVAIDGRELRTILPEKETSIRQLVVTRDRIFASYLESGVTTVDIWLLTGECVGQVSLPAGGTIQILPSQGQDVDTFFYTFESFNHPPTIYEFCVQANTSTVWHRRGVVDRLRSCHVQEVRAASADGTAIPLTLVSLACDDRPPRGPVIMTTYGGFGIAMTPQFSVLVTIMMELGAVFAVPQIRGGGEFGRAWHDAGRARNRQTAFEDFISAAEWLCQRGVTTPEQLAIFGGSNSGLLVAAAMTQRPDLFGAVLCIAPMLDMLRYEVFDQAAKWRSEYGTVEDPDDFQALYAYSPYHHVAEDTNYPATMFVSGDKDDRCNPAHVRKMTALLQQRCAQKSPVIVDYSEERGHSPVLPLSVRISALARRIAFLCRELHIALPKGDLDEAPHS